MTMPAKAVTAYPLGLFQDLLPCIAALAGLSLRPCPGTRLIGIVAAALVQMLQAEVDQSYRQVLKDLKDNAVSLRLNISGTFSKPESCSLLALYIQDRQQLPAGASQEQWEQGRSLEQQFLQSHRTLEAAAQVALQQQAAECSSGWLGRHAPDAECTRIDICDGQNLELQCVVPSKFWKVGANSFGGHAVSHMHGSARKPVTYYIDNKALANTARTSIMLSAVMSLGLVLLQPQARQEFAVAYSKLELVSTADLRDVERVQVLVGTIPFGREWFYSGPATIVRQLVFQKRNGSSIRIPDCPESQLLGAAGTTHTFPPEGCAGQIAAVSAQGNAFRFHWVPA
jgi:hypothetical protein